MTRRDWRRSLRVSPLYDPESAVPVAAPLRPAYRERVDGRRRHRVPVCPAKMFATHPDKQVRAVAFAQAREAHALNDIIAHGVVHDGPCRAKACRDPFKIGVHVVSLPAAVKWRKANGLNVLGA